MKHSWLIVFLILGAQSVRAQNTVFFGHYMFNPTYFNPAWGGGEKEAFIAFQHRSQWLGYNSSFDGSGGAPTTQMLTALFPIQGIPVSSFGLNVINDDLGPVNNFHIAVPITYTMHLRQAELSLGVAPALFAQRIQSDQYRPNDPDDPILQELAGNPTQINPNLTAGIFYRSNRGFFIGAGIENLLQPGIDYGVDGLDNEQEIAYNVHAGHIWHISDNFSISPTMIVRSDLNNFTFDIGAIATLREKMWTGLSFRKSESAILYLGYSLLQDNKLKVGYSFDYVLVDQAAKAATTHEIFIRYDLPDLVFGGRKKVKTPRFSF